MNQAHTPQIVQLLVAPTRTWTHFDVRRALIGRDYSSIFQVGSGETVPAAPLVEMPALGVIEIVSCILADTYANM